MKPRSELLRPWPARARRGSGLTRRLLLLLAVSAVLLALLLSVNLRVWPPERYPLLYRLHDELFLPLRGHLYQRFLPWGLVAWGLALTFVLWWLSAWLFNAAPGRALQRWLIGRALRQPRQHERLLRWAKRFAWLRVEPHLLRLVAEDHWRSAGHDATLGALLLRLQPLFRRHPTAEHLRALDTATTSALAALSADATTRRDAYERLRAALDALPPPDDDTHPAPFALATLASDTRRMLNLYLGDGSADALLTLAQHDDARRQRLDAAYRHLHHQWLSQPADNPLPLPADVNPRAGRVALALAVLSAVHADAPAHARAYRAAAESLLLLSEAGQTPAARAWNALLSAPHPLALRVLAALNQRQSDAASVRWRAQRDAEGRLIYGEDDAALMQRAQVDALRDAAQPL